MNDLTGKQLGKYRILQLLGVGGYAAVYLGEHIHLGTSAAIKVLHQVQMSSADAKRFETEAKTIAMLRHDHIVPIRDYGVQESTGILYLVMDYMPGTLRQRYPRGTRSTPIDILPCVKQVACALQHAHNNNVIHRDVKPENMLLDDKNNVRLSDFGIAIVYETSHPSATFDQLGTPYYRAPEQYDGAPEFASDQYSLGIVIYEWLCGNPPFTGAAVGLPYQHKHVPPPSMCEQVPSLSPKIEEVVQKALAKRPEERYSSVWKFAMAFEKACLEAQEKNDPRRTIPSSTSSSQSHSPRFPLNERGKPRVATPLEDSSIVSNVPYLRNPFFTGYDDVLASLHDTFNSKKTAIKTQAISGLGGIGKTQAAIEYVYRYYSEYQKIFWVQGDTGEKMQTDIAALAGLLGLKEQHQQEQTSVIEVVHNWLRKHTKWLLIADNVEDLRLVQTLLPSDGRGHILLTTRTQTTGNVAECIDLRKMTREESTLFLLKRTKRVSPVAALQDASSVDRQKAEAIAELLDGLPLALDQAGSYIEETGCSFSNYLCHFQDQHKKLLDKRGSFDCSHPASVAATFSSSFEKVAKISPAAIELLRFCAFLSPENIPEDLIIDGATELGSRLRSLATDSILLDEVLRLLRKFSLVHRYADTNTISLHRLIQIVLQDTLNEKMQRMWVERTVRAVNRVFPDVNDFSQWHLVQRYIPHVQRCVDHIEKWVIVSPEAARLLEQMGVYLQIQGQFTQSLTLFEQAEQMRTSLRDTGLAAIVTSLTHRFWHYYYQGRYSEAEQPIRKALKLLQQTPDADQPTLASCLCAIAHLCYQQGKYSQAEEYFLQALVIYEQRVGLQHPSTICIYCGLGNIHLARARFEFAEKSFSQALAIWQKVPEPQHPFMANSLTGMARLSLARAQYARAEQYLQKARAHLEQTLPTPHPALASQLNDLALLYLAQGKYKDLQVEQLLNQALVILKQTVGLQHPIAGSVFDTLGRFFFLYSGYMKSEQYLAKAEKCLLKAQSIRERALGEEHPASLSTTNKLADVYRKTPLQESTAEELYKYTQARRIHLLGAEHPAVAQTLQGLAQLYYDKQEYQMYILAEQLYKDALAIRENALGKDHPAVARSLLGLATINFWKWKKYDEADVFIQQALDIYEKAGIPDHPDVASIRNTQALLKKAINRHQKREMLQGSSALS